jgi:hypothetical protein
MNQKETNLLIINQKETNSCRKQIHQIVLSCFKYFVQDEDKPYSLGECFSTRVPWVPSKVPKIFSVVYMNVLI